MIRVAWDPEIRMFVARADVKVGAVTVRVMAHASTAWQAEQDVRRQVARLTT